MNFTEMEEKPTSLFWSVFIPEKKSMNKNRKKKKKK